jgi:hypothetical protein
MTLADVIDWFIWGGLDLAKKLPYRLLRFFGVIVAFIVMCCFAPIWIPLLLFSGFKEIWDDLK